MKNKILKQNKYHKYIGINLKNIYMHPIAKTITLVKITKIMCTYGQLLHTKIEQENKNFMEITSHNMETFPCLHLSIIS